jgi:ATP-dependent DNA ligase
MLALGAPMEAMEARSVDAIPAGKEWQYEPKWDGFRCLLARNGDAVSMRSKSGQDLARYFPEVVAAARDLRAREFLLDGELVVQVGRQFSFDDLLQRIPRRQAACGSFRRRSPLCFWLSICWSKAGKIWRGSLYPVGVSSWRS